ncbi:hypothetical protein [Lentibacillus sediminis]|uniref:hypothetical protein n=1 Tax=Lentibacillus sediminis TaxID=1940529 RepID=UPI000C1C3BEA|nr:hypothetical protein [Lentibacillus sediminis]
MKRILYLAVAGIFSGLLLGAFLKIVQAVSGKRVYTLLLNVDYFPVLQNWELGEVAEFMLHLAVSVALVFVLYAAFVRCGWSAKFFPYVVANVLIGALLFLTTLLSNRTPELIDGVAFLYWLAGHLVYGVVLGILLSRIKKD